MLTDHRHSYSFVIHVTNNNNPNSNPASSSTSLTPKFGSFSTMKIFSRFGKFIMRLMLSPPPRGSSSRQKKSGGGSGGDERFDPPKTSCSSYISSQTHYSEAIADCIEFFNKSSVQEGTGDDGSRPSDLFV